MLFCRVIPLVVISHLFNRRVPGLQTELHNAREDLYQVFQERDPGEIHGYYEKLEAPQIKMANWGALNSTKQPQAHRRKDVGVDNELASRPTWTVPEPG